MEGENAHANRRIWKSAPRHTTLPRMLLTTNTGVPEFDLAVISGACSPLTHMRPRAREKSLNFFAVGQQQVGNWPISCCDGLGLPSSSGSF